MSEELILINFSFFLFSYFQIVFLSFFFFNLKNALILLIKTNIQGLIYKVTYICIFVNFGDLLMLVLKAKSGALLVFGVRYRFWGRRAIWIGN